jgi:xylitol oxidase
MSHAAVLPRLWFARPAARTWSCVPSPGEVADFHAGLPGYAPTPLVELPGLAFELGVGRVFVKDESARLGLPAFKVLGASWAIHRALAGRTDPVRLVTATDGNHGRAVARIGRLLGNPVRVFVPQGVHPVAMAAIAAEGAEVVPVEGPYDLAVQRAAAERESLLIQDTAWPGYEQVPGWIVEGYATLFTEIDAQLRALDARPPSLVAVPVGVGSLAQAAVIHYRSRRDGPALLSVEPAAAACVLAGLERGRPTTIPTGNTIMAGLNCGTPSSLAWPFLEAGLDAAIAVSDAESLDAARDLAAAGVSAGPCGAASLAGVRAALAEDDRRSALGIGPASTVVLLSTEGTAANPALSKVMTTNWAGNITFNAEHVHRPTSLDELRALVSESSRVRALGTGHSFSPIADTTGELISVASLPPEIELSDGTVSVAGGVRYGELAVRLQELGFALHNLGSLPHISVAGACATGTHGSGVANGNLSTAVSALELVTAGGDLVELSRAADGDRFAGAVVGLGRLGIVTRLTLDVQPTFEVDQHVYEDVPPGEFEEILSSAYSVSLFTTWRGAHFDQVWVKRRLDAGPAAWRGAKPADGPRHPVPGMSPVHCTPQLGVPGPWHERLPHFRLGFTPSSGEELQSEYLVPRAAAAEALKALDGIRDRIAAVLQISEIRTIAADDLWLSPSHRQDSVAFHFTWIKDHDAVAPVLRLIEERLTGLGARPHWGKLFSTAPQVVSGMYERLPDFRRLCHELDPQGKFANAFTDRYI